MRKPGLKSPRIIAFLAMLPLVVGWTQPVLAHACPAAWSCEAAPGDCVAGFAAARGAPAAEHPQAAPAAGRQTSAEPPHAAGHQAAHASGHQTDHHTAPPAAGHQTSAETSPAAGHQTSADASAETVPDGAAPPASAAGGCLMQLFSPAPALASSQAAAWPSLPAQPGRITDLNDDFFPSPTAHRLFRPPRFLASLRA
ncbi:MAG: hypothetical protein LBS31_04555, partial [Candidatus Adiutrix sp.]|nr:hypothetical protein [Candidatus Adiutrix sp.]